MNNHAFKLLSLFALIVCSMLGALPGIVDARDPGINQPGAAGNRRGVRR